MWTDSQLINDAIRLSQVDGNSVVLLYRQNDGLVSAKMQKPISKSLLKKLESSSELQPSFDRRKTFSFETTYSGFKDTVTNVQILFPDK